MGKATGVKPTFTPDQKRLRAEKKLENASKWGIGMAQAGDPDLEKEGYATSLGSGAKAAGNEVQEKIWQTENKTLGQSIDDPRSRQAMREAAAEERREARGKKKGGLIKSASTRGDGIAQRGKTKGRMV